MDTLTLLQHYWWLIISLLGALLVFLLFVQGGQGLLYDIGKTEEERNMLVNSLGRKWEFTFTTLVTFGGAFFASFPLFYSTSFGGAFYVWMAILLVFVIQAVAYEYRRKPLVQIFDHAPRTIAGTVVHQDYLVRQTLAASHAIDPFDQLRQGLLLVIERNDDRYVERSIHRSLTLRIEDRKAGVHAPGCRPK